MTDDRRQMLLVDDSDFNRQVLKELFQADFDILEASDGERALALMRAFSPTLAVVLLDLIMPRKDGLDVLREVRGDVLLSAIPIIVTSSATDHAYRLKALELGAADYIAMPFNPMLARLRVRGTLATREYERLRLQNELLSLQSREDAGYRALLEDASTAILEFDGRGHILRYDPSIARALAGRYDGREFVDVLREDCVADARGVMEARALFERVLSGDEAASECVDLPLARPDGSRSWFRLRLLKRTQAQTGETRLTMSVSDIDRQKRQEEATRAETMRALGEAESANRAKSEFLSRMSHEIRTPLNAIIGFVELMRERVDDPDRVSEYLAKTDFASKHLLSIINDILDMSAIESGRMSIVSEPCDLKELVTSVTAISYPLAHRKGLNFSVVLDGLTHERIVSDQMRLSQILINLLSNAVKFTPKEGSVTLRVGQRAVEGGCMMTFAVSDTGVGMSKAFLKRVGQPFEQQSAGVARRYGGSGLGLSITKNLVSLMHGTLTIESEEGKGSTFTVTLPADTQYEERRAARDFPGTRVLVVDGQQAAAEQTAAYFRGLGCRCECMSAGEVALGLLERNDYDLLLLDWRLRDMGGRHVLEGLRRVGRSDLIVVVTAFDYGDISQNALEGLRFVQKPVFPSTVLELMTQLFGEYEPERVEADARPLDGMRLLLAEDNDMNVEITSMLLGKLGCEVEVARNGREACEAFEASGRGAFDAVLMDVRMPEMDGYAATRRIRASAHPDAASVPIIAMTASAFTHDMDLAKECGMTGYLSKPVETDGLRKALADAVAAHGSEGGIDA